MRHARRILVADDEEKMRRMLELALKGMGHEVAQACDGEEALACSSEGDFDLVLTDLGMPNLDGIDLFVAVNCAAIPGDLPENELFGFRKGAFTGADRDRMGRFEAASGGTVFLDEVTEMPLALQGKLLRVLQESTVERLGTQKPIEVDLRVVAATNRDPQQAVAEGRLRQDLHYRLDVVRIEVPPLRDRQEDVLLLAVHFLEKYGRELGRKPPRLAEESASLLRGTPGPATCASCRI